MSERSLSVYINEREIGTLSESENIWQFRYEAAWVTAGDSYPLSPALPLTTDVIQDGGSLRPVQWYFDNLLPEETLREDALKKAGIRGNDAFALLEYLGAETAGSLTLLPKGTPLPQHGSLKPLSDADLYARIKDLPRTSLADGAPKRMSVAGAQHKLLVVYRDGELFEPVGAAASTHILKPNHPTDRYKSTVINEFFIMRVAQRLQLEVPIVERRYTPEPVYLIERFDRVTDSNGAVRRLHIIDACQLLNRSSLFKYPGMNLETLKSISQLCRSRGSARQRLYQWVVFNTLVGNNDNHLKNLSFLVSHEGIELAPHYDMLSTAVYDTKAMDFDKHSWPDVGLTVRLPGAETYGQVTQRKLIEAGVILGLSASVAERQLHAITSGISRAVGKVTAQINEDNANVGADATQYLNAEARVLRTIEHLVIHDMLAKAATEQPADEDHEAAVESLATK